MTLAGAILLFSISCTTQPSWGNWLFAQTAPATGNASQNQAAAPTATQSESPKPDTATKPSTAKPHPATAPKKRQPKKKIVTSNCDVSPAPATSTSTSSNPPTALQDPTNADAASAPATAPPPKNCPPPKIIVRQGGVSEPSIQLAGGDKASPKKDSVNRMLQSTEGNLKKLSGQTLDTTQQGTVSQIRQFMDQSKEALAGGDVERAHTLAWKAELLSEDLVKPSN